MAKKLVALFVLCVVAMAALRGCDAAPKTIAEKFKECFTTCQKECQAKGNGYTFCEVRCDEDCTAKEAADKLSMLS